MCWLQVNESLCSLYLTRSPLTFHPHSIFHSSSYKCLCQWQGRVYVCLCVRMRVWTCIGWLTLCTPGCVESRCMRLFCTTQCFGLRFVFDAVFNPASRRVPLQECCDHFGFSHRLSPTDWLTATDFQLRLCCALLAKTSPLVLSSSHHSVWCPSFFWRCPPSFLRQHCAGGVQQCLQLVTPSHPPAPTARLSVLPYVHLEPEHMLFAKACLSLTLPL